MKTFLAAIALGLSLGATSLASYGADVELYPTGPTEDAAFLRFVDGTGLGMRVVAKGSAATLDLAPGLRASPYRAVAGGSSIAGKLVQNEQSREITVAMQPGEFVTVLSTQTENGLHVETLHEAADDFTAVRASIAFYNLNNTCQDAGIQVAGRAVFLFEHVSVRDWMRRQINPVPLSVQLMCAGQAVGDPLDLGTLQAGDRHSLFLVQGDPAASFFHVKDSVTD